VGQRKGLGLAMPEPVYVTEIDAAANTVRVGSNKELEHKGVLAENPNWIAIENLKEEMNVEAKIRYNDPGAPATIKIHADKVEVLFAAPQRAATPGQSVVFYQQDVVVGGAVIHSAIK